MEQYRLNLQQLFKTCKRLLDMNMFIWATALPVSKEVRGSVILQEMNFLEDILHYDMLLVNHTASRMAMQYGFDVLDLHHAMR